MRNGAIRLSVVVLSIGAWLALSNHCAIGAVATSVESPAEAGGCPMHSKPAKKKPVAKTPCCKDVRAIVAKCATASGAPLRLIGSREYTTEIFAQPSRAPIALQELDTGPPGSLSFAESVLQESMLSHAPPLS